MTNSNDDRIYSSLVKICIILTTLFTFWLAWDHFSNRPLGYNEYSAANKAFKDKNYERLLPPLTLLSIKKQKELLNKLKSLDFISTKDIAA